MTIATIEAEIKEAAVKIGVEADHLANAIRAGLADLLHLAETAPDEAAQLVKEAQPAPVVTTVDAAVVDTHADEPAAE